MLANDASSWWQVSGFRSLVDSMRRGGFAPTDGLTPAARIDQMARRVLRGMIGSGAWDKLTCTVGCGEHPQLLPDTPLALDTPRRALDTPRPSLPL